MIQPKIGYMDAMRSAPSLPLGLLHAASWLTERYDVEVIDARLSDRTDAGVLQHLTVDTLFVGITTHTGPMLANAIHLSRFVKANSDIPVVWGGVHASLDPEQTLAEPAVDICVIGEGEETVFDLAKALETGSSLHEVTGIAFRDGSRVVKTAERALLPPEKWTDAAYDLIDLKRYLPQYEGRPSLYFQASRGCPFDCGFCYNRPFNRRHYRKLAPDVVIDRIDALQTRAHFSDVYFVDDNFFIDLSWAEKIGSALSERNLTWQVQGIDISSLLKMDDHYISRIKKYGCQRLTLGVESASQRIRKLIRKQGSRDDILKAVSRFEGADMILYASFMVGFPTETRDEMMETVKLALELVDRFDFFRCSPIYIYTPFPGTTGLDQAVAQGFSPPNSPEEWVEIGAFEDTSWERVSNGYLLDRRLYEGLNLTSLFFDNKVRDYSSSLLIRILSAIYRPIARLRAKKLFFRLMPERYFLSRFFKRYTRGD